jgi:hypothetical protein
MKRLIWILPVLASGFLAIGCPSFPEACDYGGCLDGGADGVAVVDGSSGDGSVDAKADADPPPPGCDTPNEPLKNPEKCLVDSFGVFVSPAGDDGNPGTKAKPLKTIGAALATARSRIVACEGEYGEALEIKRDVEIYSGITCTFDKAGGKATIKPEAATGLVVSAGSTSLFDVAVVAKAGAAPGESSIGIFAKAGTSLSLTRASVTAGAGADGKDAEATGNNHFASPAGNPALGATGGLIKVCACPLFGATQGGEGGNGGNAVVAAGKKGGDGASNPTATIQGTFNGAGGAGEATLGDGCGNGKLGSPGSARLGGKGAATVGSASAAGWVPGAGGIGEAGSPGLGGGGGGGSFYNAGTSAGGGGGGCGGCGGAPGNGGGGGGASIAVLALDASLTVVSSTIVTAKGGDGKSGGTGQAGGGGGGGGGTVGACSGQIGGAGAGGSGGGGGAGGPSIGIAYTGTAPSVDGQSVPATDARPGVTVGIAGVGGGAGGGGAAVTGVTPPGVGGTPGTPGAPGVAKAVVKVDKS